MTAMIPLSLAMPEIAPQLTALTSFTALPPLAHPDDRSSSDACARWRRDWHRYSIDPTNGTLIFGDQVLFWPGHKPPSDRYISWSDVVPLLNPLIALVGPFDLATSSPFSSSIRPSARQWVPLSIWQQLCSLCASQGILLPSISPQPVLRSR
jgi:hypothetical protein